MVLKFLAEKSFKSSEIFFCLRRVFFISALFVSFCAQSYVQFNSKPTKDWDFILERSGVERHYSVQRGDNLYDISKALFGDSSFWPKIWSLNSVITNPHSINKGQIIYFSGGTVFAPPSFGVESFKSQIYVYGSGLLSPEIPPGPIRRKAIAIPNSFPNYSKVSIEEESSLLAPISLEKRNALLQKRKVLVTSEIVIRRPTSLGKLKRVQTGGHVARMGSLVSVKLKLGGVTSSGQIFSVFNYSSDGLSSKENNINAGLVEWLGKIKILRQIDGDEHIAEVIDSNDLMPMGSHLSTKEFVRIDLPNMTEKFIDEQNNRKIEIIGANKAGAIQVIGEGAIVYLKGGSRLGIKENTIYPVFTNFGLGIRDKKRKYIQKSIGYVKVANVNERFSTGVAFNLSNELSEHNTLGGTD